ncbi:MAG: PTS sugar transporter subunit IIC, partial [Coprobacillus cateniformis]
INEPIIFGFPIMLNPLYVIPMVFSPAASGLVAWALIGILPISFNPTISMPWVTPGFITVFFQGGVFMLLLWLISLAIHFVMYLPFFLIDDNNALKQEQELKAK